MKSINASIIIFTSLVITSNRFANAAQQLRGQRGLENEDVVVSVSFVNDTSTGEMAIISNAEDIDNPAPPMISASERAEDQVSDYGSECRASDGCTCTAKHVYKSTRDCVLVQSTSTVKKNNLIGSASCGRNYKLTAYDCERCQNFVKHTDNKMVLIGVNRPITNSLQLNNGLIVKGLPPYGSYTSKRDWCIKITDFHTTGNSIFAFDRDTSCSGIGPGSATSNNLYQFQKCKGNDRSEINAYQGHWVNIATDGQPQIETRVTASSTASEQSTAQFTENWSLSGTVKFGDSSVTSSYGQTMQTTSQATLAETNGFEFSLTCTTTCNAEDYTYIYKVKGYDFNDENTWIDVPSCLFHCTDPVKDTHQPPKCPPTYCDPTRGTCQCCTSLEWADADASDLPTLCDGF